MAKRRRATASSVRVVRSAPRAAAPIIKIAQPRAAPAKRKRRSSGRRRSAVRGMVGGALQSGIADAIGGALFGFAVKQGWVAKLPAIPLVGRTGTAAILLHYLAKRGGGEYVKRAAVAAAVISGYQLGSTGTILGDASTPGSLAGDDDSYADGDDDDEE